MGFRASQKAGLPAFREEDGTSVAPSFPRNGDVGTEPDAGLELANCEIVTWAEVGRPTD